MGRRVDIRQTHLFIDGPLSSLEGNIHPPTHPPFPHIKKDMAGVHTIFGSFLLGLAFPQQNPSTLRLAKTIEDFASIVFLPLYFAASGLRTQVPNSPTHP